MIPFTKMHGLGNDYVYVDATTRTIDDAEDLARRMSDRHLGIGADGLILVTRPSPGVEADLRMQMHNADGSRSEMCGNGIRCVCRFAHDGGLCRSRPMRVETGAGVLELDYTLDASGRVDLVTVDMGRPVLDPTRIPAVLPAPRAENRFVDVPWLECFGSKAPAELDACGLESGLTCVSMGNPHVVIYCRALDAVPLDWIGPRLERAPMFPNRTNVHFVSVHDAGEVSMRTWERGSGITRACGTGAAAVCTAGALTHRTGHDLLVHLPGGDLRLRLDEATGHVFMTGPATPVFTGAWPEPSDGASDSIRPRSGAVSG